MISSPTRLPLRVVRGEIERQEVTVSLTSTVADKFRRALRNRQGTRFSAEEIRHMGRLGVFHMLAKAEADEIVGEIDRPASAQELTGAATSSVAELPNVFSVRTLAERWTCSPQLIRNLIAKGELESFRHGNLIRIPVQAVLGREKIAEL